MTISPSKADRVVALTIIASQFAPPFLFSGVATALPGLGREVGAGATTLGLVETLFLATQLGFLLPGGRLADASDKRTLYKIGVLGFGLCSITIGCLSSISAILTFRCIQGAMSALCAVAGPAILGEIVPPAQRGRAFGSSIGVVYGGLTLGPLCGGLLTDWWSWRAVFLVGGALLLVVTAIVQWFLPSRWRRPERGALHLPSAAVLIAAVLSLVLGAAEIKAGVGGALLLGSSVLLFLAFFRLQRGVEKPLVDLPLLRSNRSLRGSLTIQLLLYLNAFSSVFLLNLYMQSCLGYSAKVSGQVTASGTLLMACIAPLSGRLADRFRPHYISALGVASVLVTVILARRLEAGSSLTAILVVLAFQGLGYGLFSSPNMTIIMNSVAPALGGTASALGAKARSLGMVLGMVMTGMFTSLMLGDGVVSAHPDRFIEVMHLVFDILTLTTTFALILNLYHRQGSTQ